MQWIEKWATQRGVSYEPRGSLPPVTPGLFEAAGPLISGELPGGASGSVALESYGSSEGGTVSRTVCLIEIPESIALLPKLWVRDPAFKRTRSYTLGAQGFEKDYSNFEFESVKLNRKFAIQAPPRQSENWMRQLFSPQFIDFLAERTPREFSFELLDGQFAAYLPQHPEGPGDLEDFCELASRVSERIRSECLEQEDLGVAPAGADEAGPRHAAEMAAKIEWPEPPRDVATALRAYLPLARAEGGTVWPALKVGGGIGLLILLVPLPFMLLFQGAIDGPADIALAVNIASVLILALIAGGLGGWLFRIARRNQIHRRAAAYARIAFVDAYARSRGLEVDDPRAFHGRFMRVDLPGPARHVMSGTLPRGGASGHLLLCRDPAGGAGYLVAMTATRAERPPDADGFSTEVQDGQLLVYAKVDPATGSSVKGLDAVWERAGELSRG